MTDHHDRDLPIASPPGSGDLRLTRTGPETSRRTVLRSAAALATVAATGAVATRSERASAQDAELTSVLGGRRLLLKGGVVLTGDPRVGDFAQGDVLIEDGKISAVGPNLPVGSDAAVIIDATNRIVIPGFVDTHVHAYQGLLRSSLPNGVVDPDYNRDIQNNLTAHYQPEDAYAGELITALAMIANGTTTIVDISQVNHSPEHSDAVIRALQESGMRAVFAYSRGIGPRHATRTTCCGCVRRISIRRTNC